jgi:hypothetical protein
MTDVPLIFRMLVPRATLLLIAPEAQEEHARPW